MKLSYNELRKYGIEVPVEELVKKFFQLGHEVEEIEEIAINNLIIGEIKEIEKHPEADKLNICKVDIGKEKLQIVCGAPNVKVNQKVIVAMVGAEIEGMKIKPIELKGIKSNGMICSLKELGFSKEILNKEDYEGIHEIIKKVEIGQNPMEILNFQDFIFDVFLTANRGDCQSYRGLINEISALLNFQNNTKKYMKFNPELIMLENKLTKNETELKIEIENPFLIEADEINSKYFSHQYIENVKVEDTEWDDKLFLIKHGISSQNSITDISNEVMLRTGIPSHIYDADKIVGKLKVHTLEQEEEFVGLNEKKIKLPIGTLVISDAKKIVAIAGIMGSNETKVTKETKNILLEVGEFNSQKIFQSTKLLGKKTESSLRYEKGIDLSIIEKINKLIVSKIKRINSSAKISEMKIISQNNKIENKITIEIDYINKILGIKINKDEILSILENLEFKINMINENTIELIAPNYRKDIESANDIVEEIIRLYNVDNIPVDDTLTSFISMKKISLNDKAQKIKEIEENLLMQGMNEVITYSLINETQLGKFGQNKDNAIELMSPLSNEHKYYRQSLCPSLIEIAKYNFARQQKKINFFEIGETYQKINSEIIEETKLAALISGDYQNEYLGAKRKYDFYDLKKITTNLFDKFGMDYKLDSEIEEIKGLNKYASGKIIVEGKEVGFIGELDFDYFKKMANRIYVLEISISKILEMSKKYRYNKYNKINNLPTIQRDITIEVNKNKSYDEVKKLTEKINYLQNILLLDIYEGEHINKDKKAITIRLFFENNDETLTNEIIDKEMEKIINIKD